MAKVKLAFIGCGYMGQMAHMQNYAQVADCEIVAIAETKKKQAERVAAMYNIPHVYTDYMEMLR
jgi:predicted dehydrogenase